MSYTQKMVNGVAIDLSPEEIAELEARDAAWTAGNLARQAKENRLNLLAADVTTIDWINRLTNATAAQIDAYFAANVTSPAQAIAVLKAVVKVLALKL